jgi:cytochrome c-type biogenesis protein CcmH
MIGFWIIAGLFLAGALLFVLPPLLRRGPKGQSVSRGAVNATVYRDQLRELDADLQAGTLSRERHGEARSELERRLLEDASEAEAEGARVPPRGRLTAVVLGLAVPLIAVGLYLTVGNPGALAPEGAAEGGAPHSLDARQVEAMVERLAAWLQANPEDAEGWVMLARSYNALERYREAAMAYASASARVPGNAQLLADYADTLAMAQGRRLQGEPEIIIRRALQIDPGNLKALALAGTVAFEEKKYAEAVAQWEKILRLVPPDSDISRSVQSSIAEAQSLGKNAGAASRATAPDAPRAAGGAGARVSGVVRLAPALASRIAPTDTVFIFARAVGGPRMPLALIRKQAADLPVKYVLDDTMAMAPGMKLSSFKEVVIGARVSKTANATALSGDLEGLSAPVKVGSADIAVVIDNIVR